jgi:hypothetical protein
MRTHRCFSSVRLPDATAERHNQRRSGDELPGVEGSHDYDPPVKVSAE